MVKANKLLGPKVKISCYEKNIGDGIAYLLLNMLVTDHADSPTSVGCYLQAFYLVQ